jgi:hypothetical protein
MWPGAVLSSWRPTEGWTWRLQRAARLGGGQAAQSMGRQAADSHEGDHDHPWKGMTAARVIQLEAMGFTWHLHDAVSEKSFAKLEAHQKKHGNCNVLVGLGRGQAARQMGQLAADVEECAGPQRLSPGDDGGAGQAGGARLRVQIVYTSSVYKGVQLPMACHLNLICVTC